MSKLISKMGTIGKPRFGEGTFCDVEYVSPVSGANAAVGVGCRLAAPLPLPPEMEAAIILGMVTGVEAYQILKDGHVPTGE